MLTTTETDVADTPQPDGAHASRAIAGRMFSSFASRAYAAILQPRKGEPMTNAVIYIHSRDGRSPQVIPPPPLSGARR